MVWIAPKSATFVMVDPQVDFCPEGRLPVPEGDKIIPVLNDVRRHFQTVCITQDWHPAGHSSFASTHGLPAFSQITMPYGPQILWPDHCVQDSDGAAFHPDLVWKAEDLILRKGTNPHIDSYSAFFENDRVTRPVFSDGRHFAQMMRDMGIDTLVFGGLVREICVAWNALDAVREGFKSVIVLDATKKLDTANEEKMMLTLKAQGVDLLLSSQLQTYFTHSHLKHG